MEFHVSRPVRTKYKLDDLVFSKRGKLILANNQTSRVLADQVNKVRGAKLGEKNYVPAGQINALGTLDEVFHFVIDNFFNEYGKSLRHQLYKYLTDELGTEAVDRALSQYVQEFPPAEVLNHKLDIKTYLEGETDAVPNKVIILEEIILTWLENVNPAAVPYNEFFDDSKLRKQTIYDKIIAATIAFFKSQPAFGPDKQDLISMLRAPAIMVPDSLRGQLEYIKEHWGKLLGDLLLKLLGSLDMIKEEEKGRYIFTAQPDHIPLPDYSSAGWGDLPEIDRFSPDSDWMPRVVMIAKNSYVWLSQLSKQYGREINHLDQIPDETLDELKNWGFTGLWLIGLWERSEASRRIKVMCGNPDAVSSAYSLSRYQIADRLGGEAAYLNLSERCGKRGIRLASDMVPNHMGIDSEWVYDHPDWFIGQDYSPFPSYSFAGPDLSQNPNVSIQLEDHYYDRSDAAVVFKRYDHRSGQTRYIYHGNDGTSMPWNDTAQLDYLNPTVREAVIQTILEVARRFPIIRFDAAMTLAKKHYQRLWFPVPGTGGDIASRAEHAMTKADFDKAMPEEFWREVVERVAKEVPNTLLLAEAFWMMEGYFVRSLGMHRVYNSAFMHMMRNEDNAKYRELMRSTLVYDPQILQRYVNFMNNPDEKTAVEQFGKGDKYFGIATVMCTLPGLPMFGHGQLEGFAEKYGMEYYRPYWDETPDQDLLNRHWSDISPLMHRRWLFANVDNFRLYDFETGSGIDENVFAYSNNAHGQASLVVFNNSFSSTSGWIKHSNPYLVKGANAHVESAELAPSLLLNSRDGFLKFRDYVSKLTYLRPVGEVFDRGLHFELSGYAHQVLMDFEIVNGSDYAQLCEHMAGRGVKDLEQARKELLLGPGLDSLRNLLQKGNLEATLSSKVPSKKMDATLQLLSEACGQLSLHEPMNTEALKEARIETRKLLTIVSDLKTLGKGLGLPAYLKTASLLKSILTETAIDTRIQLSLAAWALLSNLGGPSSQADSRAQTSRLLNEAPVSQTIQTALQSLGYTDHEAWKTTQLIKWLVNHKLDKSAIKASSKRFASQITDWIKENSLREYLEVNKYEEIDWYQQERFATWLWYLQTTSAILIEASKHSHRSALSTWQSLAQKVQWLKEADQKSSCQVDKFIAVLKKSKI